MNIQTDEERNEVLTACGCCPFPNQPQATWETECRSGSFGCFHSTIRFPSGWGFEAYPWDDGSLNDEKAYAVETETEIKTDSTGRFYQKDTIKTWVYNPVTFACSQTTVVNESGANFNYPTASLISEVKSTTGVPGDASVQTRIYREYQYLGTVDITIDNKYTYTSYITKAQRRTYAITEMEAESWGACAGGVESSLSFGVSSATKSPFAVVRQKRIRWRIFEGHTGSYYKVTWDVINEPDWWDEDPVEPPGTIRSWLLEDQTWVWSGPGTPGVDATWRSPWFEIDVPTVAGQNRPVNFRGIGILSTKFGSAPYTFGPADEP